MNIQLSDHFTYRRLLRFTFPSIVMMVLTSIYGVVDGVFVSNFVGSEAFASINIIMPFLMILGALGFMVGTGGSALVSLTFGAGDLKKGREIFSLLVYTLVGLGLLFTLLGEVFLEPVSRLLGADDALLPGCVTYGRIILLALVPYMLENVFQSFMVVAERPQLGLIITIAAGVANVFLDAFFIAVLRLGIAGAAAATTISQCVGGLIPLIYFILPNQSKLRLGKTRLMVSAIVKTCINGSSEFMTTISMSVVTMFYNRQLMRFSGSDGVAVYGVIMYVAYIFASIFIGYSMGSAPIVGYHYGAGNRKELRNILDKSLRIILGLQILLTLLAEVSAPLLAGIFVRYNADLFAMTVHAFRIYSLSFLLTGFNLYASSFFTALNDGFVSAAISFCRTMIFETGCVLILPTVFGLGGIWFSICIAEILALCLSTYFFFTKSGKYGYR